MYLKRLAFLLILALPLAAQTVDKDTPRAAGTQRFCWIADEGTACYDLVGMADASKAFAQAQTAPPGPGRGSVAVTPPAPGPLTLADMQAAIKRTVLYLLAPQFIQAKSQAAATEGIRQAAAALQAARAQQ